MRELRSRLYFHSGYMRGVVGAMPTDEIQACLEEIEQLVARDFDLHDMAIILAPILRRELAKRAPGKNAEL